MNVKELHTHLGNEWVKIIGISDELKRVLTGFEGDNLFGYVYIDHTAGITLDVIKLFDLENDNIVYKESPSDKETRIISRLEGIIKSKEIHILSDEQIDEFELNTPDYLSVYDRPDLAEFRAESAFHEFRGDGYPDDVQVLILPTGNFKPELIWGRVENYEDSVLTCNLLNQPHQKLGLKINDTIQVVLQNFEDENYLVCVVESPQGNERNSGQSSKKPWYKFW